MFRPPKTLQSLRHSLILLLLAGLLTHAESQTFPGNLTGWSMDGKTAILHADTVAVRILFCAADIARIDLLPSPSTHPDSSFVIAIAIDTSAAIMPVVEETDSTLSLATASMTIVCRKQPLRLALFDAAKRLLVAEPANGGLGFLGLSRSARFAIGTNDHYYGTGERGTALDRRGQAFDSYNTQSGGYTSPLATMNINIPFVASTNGYALYFDNTYPGRFDFGSAVPGVFSYTASGGEMTFYCIAAAGVPRQLERYTWLTGRQPLPPRWALGFIQSKYGYHNSGEASTMVTTMRSKGIPCDAIVLDLYWFNAMGDLAWNAALWTDPHGMMSNFLSQGFKTIVITEPYIVQTSINYGTANAAGFFARNASGAAYTIPNWWSCNCTAALLDITNPGAASWWWGKHPAFFGSELAGIWTDLGEPENHPSSMLHTLGSAPKVHNVYNLLWAKLLYEGFQAMRPGERLFNLTRSGFAGIQRYGVIPWSGDVGKGFGGLAVQQAMMLGMGMSGLAYHNSDIGGFCCGTTTPELYVRWMQYGVFCPITRAHGTGQPTEPWGYGAQAESIATKFLKLRYRLLPYNYTLAHENYATGMPLARPLFFDTADQGGFANESGTYMWGPSFLVSPVVAAGQTAKNVYIPRGLWVDYWSDSVYHGGGAVTVAAPLDRIPLFVKAGAIVPMQGDMNYSDERPLDTLFLEVYPNPSAPGAMTMYEDDGKTLAYQTSGFATTTFTQEISSTADSTGSYQTLDLLIGNSVGTFNGKLAHRTYIAAIHGVTQRPASVAVNSTAAQEQPSYDAVRSSGGYYYDSAVHRLFIQVSGSTDSSYLITAARLQTTASVERNADPLKFSISQNYPNPFNPATTIRYSLPHAAHVRLSVYNLLGQEVAVLVDRDELRGERRATFDAHAFATGVYFYRLQAGEFVETKKLVVVR